jgi:hypothetical protein
VGTYTLQDFLLFSPRVYWRTFELHNQAVWPLQFLALLLGAAILVWVVRPHPWSSRAILAILAAAWMWVAWAFLWSRYSTINWAAAYVAPAFGFQALLLGWFAGVRGHVHFEVSRSVSGATGFMLLLYALILHPFLAKFAGRPFAAAEVFGIAPDPTGNCHAGAYNDGIRPRMGTAPSHRAARLVPCELGDPLHDGSAGSLDPAHFGCSCCCVPALAPKARAERARTLIKAHQMRCGAPRWTWRRVCAVCEVSLLECRAA